VLDPASVTGVRRTRHPAQKHVHAKVAERCAAIVGYGCRQKEAAQADSLDYYALAKKNRRARIACYLLVTGLTFGLGFLRGRPHTAAQALGLGDVLICSVLICYGAIWLLRA
jgi:hypothetical protein